MYRSADTPSTSEWCTLENTANRPSSSPSTTCTSHIGRCRSSSVSCQSETCWKSSRMRPGCGNAECRTWYSRSISSTSDHHVFPRMPTGSAGRRPNFSLTATCDRIVSTTERT